MLSGQNFRMYRGNSQLINVALSHEDGTPYDPGLGAQIKWRLTKNAHSSDEDSLISKSLGNGINQISGGVAIVIDAQDSDIAPGIYYHEMKVWDSGDVATAFIGHALVRSTVRMGDSLVPLSREVTLSGDAPTVSS